MRYPCMPAVRYPVCGRQVCDLDSELYYGTVMTHHPVHNETKGRNEADRIY